jgi:hypothetical protein
MNLRRTFPRSPNIPESPDIPDSKAVEDISFLIKPSGFIIFMPATFPQSEIRNPCFPRKKPALRQGELLFLFLTYKTP